MPQSVVMLPDSCFFFVLSSVVSITITLLFWILRRFVHCFPSNAVQRHCLPFSWCKNPDKSPKKRWISWLMWVLSYWFSQRNTISCYALPHLFLSAASFFPGNKKKCYASEPMLHPDTAWTIKIWDWKEIQKRVETKTTREKP